MMGVWVKTIFYNAKGRILKSEWMQGRLGVSAAGCSWFLTGDLNDLVKLNIKDDVGRY